eukprot:COSAG01_NODE_38869_length_484_cov_0.737662_1_plen_53_part_10
MMRPLRLRLHRQGSKLGSHRVRRLENVRQLGQLPQRMVARQAHDARDQAREGL